MNLVSFGLKAELKLSMRESFSQFGTERFGNHERSGNDFFGTGNVPGNVGGAASKLWGRLSATYKE